MNKVLFVCVHNSGRSQMAEAFFNSLAKGRAVGVSAGLEPDTEINPTVVEAMREAGVNVSSQRPKALTPDMLEEGQRVITMGCGVEGVCPASLVPTEDWALEDPRGKTIEEVRKIRDEIKARVEILLTEL